MFICFHRKTRTAYIVHYGKRHPVNHTFTNSKTCLELFKHDGPRLSQMAANRFSVWICIWTAAMSLCCLSSMSSNSWPPVDCGLDGMSLDPLVCSAMIAVSFWKCHRMKCESVLVVLLPHFGQFYSRICSQKPLFYISFQRICNTQQGSYTYFLAKIPWLLSLCQCMYVPICTCQDKGQLSYISEIATHEWNY